MKHLLPLMVLLSTTVSATAAPWPIADMWSGLASDRPHPAVVRVVVSEGETMSLGSGTLVAVRGRNGLIITNWHVVRDARGPITVVFPDGFRSGATVLGTDADWDLAALAIWRPNVEPVALSRHTPQLDDVLSIAGYGSGKYRSASGRCVQYISPGNNQPFEMLELSASAREGDSGGPIFNDRGELAGVLFGAARGRTAGSYCGRVAWFLNSIAPQFDVLSNPSTDTMIARDARAPAVAPEPATPSVSEVAVTQTHDPVDYSWQPSGAELPEPSREPSRRRSMPLASIPAPPTQTSAERTFAAADELERKTSFGAAATVDTVSTPTSGTAQPVAEAAPGEVPVRLSDLAGATRGEKIRNLLAALGVVAIIFHGLKIFSALQGEPSSKRRRKPASRRARSWR